MTTFRRTLWTHGLDGLSNPISPAKSWGCRALGNPHQTREINVANRLKWNLRQQRQIYLLNLGNNLKGTISETTKILSLWSELVNLSSSSFSLGVSSLKWWFHRATKSTWNHLTQGFGTRNILLGSFWGRIPASHPTDWLCQNSPIQTKSGHLYWGFPSSSLVHQPLQDLLQALTSHRILNVWAQ